MAKEKMEDFDLGFSPEEFEQLTPDQGVGFSRIKYGDYSFEISAVASQTSKGKTPHQMLKMTARVVGVDQSADAGQRLEARRAHRVARHGDTAP